MRADLFLQKNGYVPSRQRAQNLIAAGSVTIDGICVRKASEQVDENGSHEVNVSDICPFVSRGGLKLAGALDAFGIDVTGLAALDVGASTGGFTDCLLQRGARFVTAVDAGHGQLHERLLNDPRVRSIEGFNARTLTRKDLDEIPDVVVMDVSFISQTLLLPGIADVLDPGGILISLIKPQFEVGRAAIGKGGIVRSDSAREDAVVRVLDTAAALGLAAMGLVRSPITGGDGNIEYLFHAVKGASNGVLTASDLRRVLTGKGR